MKKKVQQKAKVFNEADLIGLSVEEAYKQIINAGLDSNLVKDPETSKVEAVDEARIMILLPNYITVEAENGIVTQATRG